MFHGPGAIRPTDLAPAVSWRTQSCATRHSGTQNLSSNSRGPERPLEWWQSSHGCAPARQTGDPSGLWSPEAAHCLPAFHALTLAWYRLSSAALLGLAGLSRLRLAGRGGGALPGTLVQGAFFHLGT